MEISNNIVHAIYWVGLVILVLLVIVEHAKRGARGELTSDHDVFIIMGLILTIWWPITLPGFIIVFSLKRFHKYVMRYFTKIEEVKKGVNK